MVYTEPAAPTNLSYFEQAATEAEADGIVAESFLRIIHQCAREAGSVGLRHLAIWCLPPVSEDVWATADDHQRRATAVVKAVRAAGFKARAPQPYFLPNDEVRFRTIISLSPPIETLQKTVNEVADEVVDKSVSELRRDGFSHQMIQLPCPAPSAELRVDPLLATLYALDDPWDYEMEPLRSRVAVDVTPLERDALDAVQALAEQTFHDQGTIWRLHRAERRLDVRQVEEAISRSERKRLHREGWQQVETLRVQSLWRSCLGS